MTIAQQLEKIGFEKGIKQGMKASARHITRQLLLNGMEPAQVCQITQLSETELAPLVDSSNK